jgi:hypothetical protein
MTQIVCEQPYGAELQKSAILVLRMDQSAQLESARELEALSAFEFFVNYYAPTGSATVSFITRTTYSSDQDEPEDARTYLDAPFLPLGVTMVSLKQAPKMSFDDGIDWG